MRTCRWHGPWTAYSPENKVLYSTDEISRILIGRENPRKVARLGTSLDLSKILVLHLRTSNRSRCCGKPYVDRYVAWTQGYTGTRNTSERLIAWLITQNTRKTQSSHQIQKYRRDSPSNEIPRKNNNGG